MHFALYFYGYLTQIKDYMFADGEIFVDHGTQLWIVLCGFQLLKSNKNFHVKLASVVQLSAQIILHRYPSINLSVHYLYAEFVLETVCQVTACNTVMPSSLNQTGAAAEPSGLHKAS